MTIAELSARLDRAVTRLDAEIEAQGAKAGLDLVALISQRVIQKGQDSEGGAFSSYSTVEVPAFFYFGRSRSGAAEAKVRAKAKKKEGISYLDFRSLNNLNASPKNFEFFGDMWRGFGVLKVQRSANGVTVTIGGRTPASEQKIGWNSEQEGKSIIAASKEEIAIVQKNLTAWAQSVIDGN